MGGTQSTESSDEEYQIRPKLQYKHSWSTVRAPHRLTILTEKKNCDYCRIVKKVERKTKYRCDKCNLGGGGYVAIIYTTAYILQGLSFLRKIWQNEKDFTFHWSLSVYHVETKPTCQCLPSFCMALKNTSWSKPVCHRYNQILLKRHQWTQGVGAAQRRTKPFTKT